ncbi:cytochrome P450 [Trametes coccinea BRFM310]|uniref:Cytochrome P450 n=1 Tax=Trametes coccinea (strain BRFM310) TaxID=1353009 RepID=A0A1Y2IXN1_TRAC3|nr:cytochrome P450 [Trametes coccinea BRFM310]
MFSAGGVIFCAVGAVALRIIWSSVIRAWLSPLCSLQGPQTTSRFYGHVNESCKAGNSAMKLHWVEQYGSNVLNRWMFMIPCLWTADPVAIRHIMHSSNYVKPWEARISAAQIIGDSMYLPQLAYSVEQNPAFGPTQIRELMHIFIEKATELRDVWFTKVAAQDGCARVDVLEDLKKMTLDVIGLGGFGYHLNALNDAGDPNELEQAYGEIFGTIPPVSLYRIFMDCFPFLDFFPDERTKRIRESRAIIRRIGMEIVREKKAAISAELAGDARGQTVLPSKDLLTLLIKANMATDLKKNQRLSDEEVLSLDHHSFLVAGHETTGLAATWCLFALTQNMQIQTQLRQELLTLQTNSPSIEELGSLPYLDAVVRETLRLYTPVILTLRTAAQDDVIPVSKPFIDRYGKTQREIRIVKDNRVIIAILELHLSKDIWGEDALQFKPERWSNPSAPLPQVPGVWGNVMAFSTGPRACLGYRFALAELKTAIFTLVRAFEFELAADPNDVTTLGMIDQKPALKSDLEQGAQMPMLIRPYLQA